MTSRRTHQQTLTSAGHPWIDTHFDHAESGEYVSAQSRSAMTRAFEETGAKPALKFFLVEDNPIIRENLAETLNELVGAEVVGFADTQHEATQWLCDPSHEWDVAVVDIFLKHGNGIQVVASLQCDNRQRRVIVLSNYASLDIRNQCLSLGADAVFDKSTELDDLLAYCAKVKLH